jgi:hypothetical protein
MAAIMYPSIRPRPLAGSGICARCHKRDVEAGREHRLSGRGRREMPVATIAFCLPRRLAMRRYRAPRKLSGRQAVAAMLPTVAASHGLPLARDLVFALPADSWVRGQNLAHDTRWASAGKRLMSTATSAISS